MGYSREMFAADLKRQVDSEIVEAIRQGLETVGGRSPATARVENSEWYNSLSADDKEMVLRIAHWSADLAVFGVLNVLDGSDVISAELSRCDLRLTLHSQDGEELFSSSKDYQGLHEHY